MKEKIVLFIAKLLGVRIQILKVNGGLKGNGQEGSLCADDLMTNYVPASNKPSGFDKRNPAKHGWIGDPD